MTELTRERVFTHLAKIRLPDGLDIVKSGRLSDPLIEGDKVTLSIQIAEHEAKALEFTRILIQEALEADPLINHALVMMTADRPQQTQSEQDPHRPSSSKTANSHKIKRIIAIASGKGGVGKSTVAANLAIALSLTGQRVGLLDADIYGPSVPKILNITESPTLIGDKTIRPLEAYGIKAMSIGTMMDPDKAIVWRGPMLSSALLQMYNDVDWGELDVLVIDMPPGTGDVPLTLAQKLDLTGAIIVSTPQDLALIDSRKAIDMFNKVDVPILGLVENMSTFICPNCGEETQIFGHGGVRDEAEKINQDFLGAIPLNIDIRTSSDRGVPIAMNVAESQPGSYFAEIIKKLDLQGK